MKAFIPATFFSPQLKSPQRLLSHQRPHSAFISTRQNPARSHSNVLRHNICAQDTLLLSEDNVNIALEEVRINLGSVFGNSAENREIGITGEVELASLDGPMIVLRLKGRFWHKRADVLARVTSYITSRIPEICDVSIEDVKQLSDTEEETSRLVSE